MPHAPHSSRSTFTVSPSITWIKNAPVLSLKAIFLLSGDQVGAKRKQLPSLVSCLGSPVPSAGRTHSSYSPVWSEKYAIHLPSGDQEGSRSATPLLRVRFIE